MQEDRAGQTVWLDRSEAKQFVHDDAFRETVIALARKIAREERLVGAASVAVTLWRDGMVEKRRSSKKTAA